MPVRDLLSATVSPHPVKLKAWKAIIFIVAICLSLVTLAIWGAWTSRHNQLQDKETAMLNLAQTLSSQAQATVKQADTVLLGVVSWLEMDGISAAQLPKMQNLLNIQRSELPQLHGLFVYDEQGRWLVNTAGKTPPNANNSDRDYFIFHRNHPDSGPHIGKSIRSRTTGEWVLTVSRRINHADGSFAGVALATIYLEHFLKLYRSIDVGKNGVISLIAADSTILLRRPFKEADIGSSLAKGPLFTELLPKASFGTAIIRSVLDGVERVAGYRRVDDYPLIIFVALDRYESLATWRKESLFSAAITSLLLAILGALGYRLIRLMKRQEYVQRALLVAQKQLLDVNQTLQLQAMEDGLTKLANRRQFDQFIRDEVGRAKRDKGAVALLMIDVDYFKRFNDEHGHLAGDECLKTVGAIIKENIKRPGDLAARYGGEEFAVVLPGTDATGAFVLAEKIRRAVETTGIHYNSGPINNVTVSLGVSAIAPTQNDLPQALIAAADKALYAAKASGRNMSVIAS